MAASSHAETLVEERQELMVSTSTGKPGMRVAHFLKPSVSTLLNTQLSQTLIKPSKPITQNLKSFTSKVNFHGWKNPLKNWATWVKKLQPSFEPTWKKASIFEPIMASTLEIPRYHDTIFALAQRWCPKTNTFVFPWGEATITLEDVMVLGGFSATGDSVLTELCSTQQYKIEEELFKARSKLLRTKAKKATQQQWMADWMENRSEFEHQAFLSCWLSRCVLPSDDENTISKSVFQIAILLANGTKIALAPAVLATIYRDLRLLDQKIGTFGGKDVAHMKRFNLWAPLQLLQAWFWERFPLLSPKPNPATNNLQRLARWHKVKILKKDDLCSCIDSDKVNFLWRPYCVNLDNWLMSIKIYSEKNEWVSVVSSVLLDLESYVRCIRVSELVGLDCVEQYLPHRVSMQFGFDQDIPVDVPRLNGGREIAWEIYNRPIDNNVKLYVPSRLTKSDVTARYLELLEKPNLVVEERVRVKLENNERDVPPGFSPKRSKTFSGSPRPIRTSSDEVFDSIPSSPSINRLEDEDDSDEHLTLSQLFKIRSTSKETRSNCILISSDSESPLSSSGDMCRSKR